MESVPLSTVPLRERGKARRQAEIVSAAADLWRTHGIENVSLNQIAARAEVAPQTIYNLIGGVDAIGFAVIKVALDRLDLALEKSSATGIALALELARKSAELYISDSALYRQVLVRIPRLLFEGVHLGRDTAETAVRAMMSAKVSGEIESGVDPERLGRTIYTNYLGALYEWACGDSEDEAFLRAAKLAVLMPAAACATEAKRAQLTKRVLSAIAAENNASAAGES